MPLIISFADDSNTFTKFGYNSLFNLKYVLDDFSNLSGLKCNAEKMFILRIGNTDDSPDPRINDLSFKITDEITLLGFSINADGLQDNLMLERVEKKFKKPKNVWGRFYLSLPGRIAIAKTLMISQLSYHCSILRPPDDWTKNIQKTIDEFSTSGLNIGKDRYYRETKVGGLGLINIDDFITSLHCAWFKRIEQLANNKKFRTARSHLLIL